ncbi:MAG: DUF1559 domain-containing protein [Planctomycetota bacterium]
MIEAENPYSSPDQLNEEQQQTKRWRSVFVALLTVAGIIAVILVLFLPAMRNSGGPSHRMDCRNNLKNIALALHNYAAKNHGVLPPTYTVDSAGKPLHSWRTLILPYIDYEDLYKNVDLSKSWNDPANAEVFKAYVKVYHCPSSETAENYTTYLAIVAPNGCFRPTEPNVLAMTDSAAEKLMVIEMAASQAVPWMSPLDADEQMVLEIGVKTASAHLGSTNVAFVDGSVSALDNSSSAIERRAMISIRSQTSPQ